MPDTLPSHGVGEARVWPPSDVVAVIPLQGASGSRWKTTESKRCGREQGRKISANVCGLNPYFIFVVVVIVVSRLSPLLYSTANAHSISRAYVQLQALNTQLGEEGVQPHRSSAVHISEPASQAATLPSASTLAAVVAPPAAPEEPKVRGKWREREG